MKKSNEIDLYAPQRQSYVAILIITYKLIKTTIRQSIPALVVIFIGGSMRKVGGIAIGVIVLGTVLSIYSIISFYKYYFYIKGNKLIVHKGVFKKTVLEIPFDRIQSINNEQNIIHRIFSVIKLNVDTAGSAQEEVQLYAIKEEVAQKLRKHILDYRTQNVEEINSVDNHMETIDEGSVVKDEIFSLSIMQLIKVGMTANHLRSFGIMVFFFFSIYDDLEEIGMDIMEKADAYIPIAQALLQSVFLILFLAVLFVFVSFIISVITTIMRYFDLTMYRIGDGFIIESGLLNRKQYAAKDSKIQILSWSQNLLQRMASIYTVVMQQASSVNTANVKNATAAGLTQENVHEVSQYVFQDKYDDLKDIEWHSIHRYYAYKLIIRWTWIFIVPTVLFVISQKYNLIILAVSLYIILVVSCILKYKKKKYGLSNRLIAIRGGAFGHQLSLMELHKVQNIKVTQTPFQRRRGLSSLAVHTASTTIHIPEISTSQAMDIKNYLLYKVESSYLPWM